MRKSFYLILFLIIIAVPAVSLTVDEAASEAIGNNPQVAVAEKRWTAAKAESISSTTWDDPMIELMYEQIPQTSLDLSAAGMKMYGFSQKVPFPGSLRIKRSVFDDKAKTAYEQYRQQKNEIVAQVKTAYYKLYFIEKSIAINSENKGLLEKLRKSAEARYIVGGAPQHDVLKAQIELSLLINDLITLEQKKKTAAARLNYLLNRNEGKAFEIAKEMNIPERNLDIGELKKLALSKRPELLAAEHSVSAGSHALTMMKLKLLPDFKVSFWQRQMGNGQLDGYNASFMANLPLWFWKEKAEIDAASEQKESLEQNLENIRQKVDFEVQEAYEKVDSSRRLVKLFKSSILPQARQMLRSASQAYEADKIDFLTLINSYKIYQDAMLKYYKNLSELGINMAELERVAGGDLF
ncbi:MAG: TolC family protein [Candidatus Margulisbacteria bacterium]|nr:TolC family protein [Candidatus Margulisiibacteriota bacterium]